MKNAQKLCVCVCVWGGGGGCGYPNVSNFGPNSILKLYSEPLPLRICASMK